MKVTTTKDQIMRKNANPNSTDVMPAGFTWKLGCFFLWALVLFSNPLFAVEKIHSEEIADSVRDSKTAQAEVNVLHIEKGAFVYGMENVTQIYTTPSDTHKNISKAVSKKKKQPVQKKTVKQKEEQRFPKYKISVVLSSHPSEESFSIGRKTSSVATLTLNHTLKAAISAGCHEMLATVFLNTNSLYTYTFSWEGTLSGASMFTRPPPFLVLQA